MIKLSAIALLTGALLAGPAHTAPTAALEFLDRHASAFVQTSGWQSVDSEQLAGDDYYTAQRFPQQGGVSMPDADLDAITKSILLLESQEPALPRVRYLVSYNLLASPEYPDLYQELIEVTRFNMGPSIRRDLADSIPAEHLGPPEIFGVGPHVSWRFAMGPLMGMRAAVLQASRMQLNDAQASRINCLGRPCLALEDPSGPAGSWSVPALYGSIPAPVFTSNVQDLGNLPVPARVAQTLFAYVAPEGMQAIPYQASKPRLIFALSKNVEGQEDTISGLVYDSNVMDDEIGAVWIRYQQVAGMDVPDLQQLLVKRKR